MPTFNTTTKYALRWLIGTNLISDIDAGFQALAEDADSKFAGTSAGVRSSRPTSTAGSPGVAGRFYRSTDTGQVDRDTGTGWATVVPAVVTALPASPDDGQVVDFVADATNGIVWRLRYRAASASSFKWEFVGGAPLATAENAAQSTVLTAASTWQKITGLTTVTIPRAGDYEMTFGALISLQSTPAGFHDVYVAPYVNLTAPSDFSTGVRMFAAASSAFYLSRRRLLVGMTAGSTLDLAGWVGAAYSPVIQRAGFSLRPIRLG